MKLSEIFCQDKAINRLQQAFAVDKMAHAYIFSGCGGIGRFTTAQAWAKMLLCRDRQVTDGFADSCGACESCRLFEGDGHPDFKPIYKELVRFTRDGKNKTTPVDIPKSVIDEFLIEKIAARPTAGSYTVYVIREAEKLNISSQNALLKVLEEPPRHCLIILISSKLESFLATILSRCQVIRFGPIDEKKIVERLADAGIDRKQGLYWARFTEGSLGQSVSLASLELKENECYSIKKAIIKAISQLRMNDAVDLAEELINYGKLISAGQLSADDEQSKTDVNRNSQKFIIRIIISAFQDAIMLATGAEKSLINADQEAIIRQIAAKHSPEKLAELIAKAYENTQWVDASVNDKLNFEELLLKMSGCGIL